jgi:hypothetical protein
MRNQRPLTDFAVLLLLPFCGAVFAQQPRGDFPPPPGNFQILSTERGFAGKVVKGAPYSATAVTETIQLLADGNRIDHKNTASVYRDTEGRTRREEAINAIGPWASDTGPHQIIFISDPVAGINYVLDPTSRTARKMADHFAPPAGPAGTREGIAPPPDRRRPGTAQGVMDGTAESNSRTSSTEALGKQTLAGMEVEGTRTTITIAAGTFGNELPVRIVDEKWISAELQVVVMSRHSDPLQGETTYQLNNISRGEQARSLFEVPPGYTVTDGSSRYMRRMKAPGKNQ